jgi:hypothetical protein
LVKHNKDREQRWESVTKISKQRLLAMSWHGRRLAGLALATATTLLAGLKPLWRSEIGLVVFKPLLIYWQGVKPSVAINEALLQPSETKNSLADFGFGRNRARVFGKGQSHAFVDPL